MTAPFWEAYAGKILSRKRLLNTRESIALPATFRHTGNTCVRRLFILLLLWFVDLEMSECKWGQGASESTFIDNNELAECDSITWLYLSASGFKPLGYFCVPVLVASPSLAPRPLLDMAALVLLVIKQMVAAIILHQPYLSNILTTSGGANQRSIGRASRTRTATTDVGTGITIGT